MVKIRTKIQNPLLKDFLKQEDNNYLFEEYLRIESPKIKDTLNKRFVKFYYKIRVVSYFSKLIEFEAINYDKKLREHNKRYTLILDKPTESANKDKLVDLFNVNKKTEITSKMEDFIEPIALKSLTNRQTKILYLAYFRNLRDTEISNLLGVSQQSITKTRHTALHKLREGL